MMKIRYENSEFVSYADSDSFEFEFELSLAINKIMININKYDVIVISIVINEDQESRIENWASLTLSHSPIDGLFGYDLFYIIYNLIYYLLFIIYIISNHIKTSVAMPICLMGTTGDGDVDVANDSATGYFIRSQKPESD